MPLTWSRAITRRVSPLCTAMVLMVVVGLVVCCGASSLLSTIVRDSFSRGTSLFSVVSIESCPSTILVTLLFRGKTESFELSAWIDSTIVPNRSCGSFFFFLTRYFNRTKCKVTREKHLETGFDVGAMVKLFRDMFQLVSFYGYFEFSRTDG